MDFALLQQAEATRDQYIINFVLMNIVFLFSYICRRKREPVFFTWLLVLVFVLYAFWDTDYFSFRTIFYTTAEIVNFRDPFYYYLSLISFDSYTFFRLLIWGTGLLLFAKIIRRFEIPYNFSIYIFAIFFLLTFSYARVSLGMAMYFYGLSYLLKPSRFHKIGGFIWGLIWIGCSYFGHRSLAALILLTPLAFIKLDKKRFVYIAIIGAAIGVVTAYLIAGLMSGSLSLGDSMGAAGEAADHYTSIEVELELNWKFKLMRLLRFSSFYIALAYIVWKTVFSQSSRYIRPEMKQLATFCLGLLVFAVSFFTTPALGADVIAYRYLYMLGIPLCVIIAYMGSYKICKLRTIQWLLLPAFLYAEGFIFGKILSV